MFSDGLRRTCVLRLCERELRESEDFDDERLRLFTLKCFFLNFSLNSGLDVLFLSNFLGSFGLLYSLFGVGCGCCW